MRRTPAAAGPIESAPRVGQDHIAAGAPFWCNTHGHGVPWLHVRFDETQKYAAFAPRGAITAASQSEWYERFFDGAFGS